MRVWLKDPTSRPVKPPRPRAPVTEQDRRGSAVDQRRRPVDAGCGLLRLGDGFGQTRSAVSRMPMSEGHSMPGPIATPSDGQM